jgi:hypothetical protein
MNEWTCEIFSFCLSGLCKAGLRMFECNLDHDLWSECMKIPKSHFSLYSPLLKDKQENIIHI